MLPKIRYKRSTKKVDIEAIVSCIKEYCDSMTSYLQNSNASLAERIISGGIDFQGIKNHAQKNFEKLKKKQITQSACARQIIKGEIASGTYKNGLEKLSQDPPKNLTLLKEIEKKLSKLDDYPEKDSEEIQMDNIRKSSDNKKVANILDELKNHFDELEDRSNIQDDNDKNKILKNIKSVICDVTQSIKNTYSHPKWRLLIEDLRYIQNNKAKERSPIIIKVKLAVVQAVKSMVALAKLVNKYLPSSSQNKIKVKSPEQYTNKIKTTKEHWEVVLYLVQKKQQKIKKQIDDLGTELSRENMDKIKNSSEYTSFQKHKENISKMILEKTT